MNIYQRLNKVRQKVAYVKKDAAVQGYRAVTHDMVTAMTRDHLVDAGVMVVPSISGEPKSVDAGQTKSGTPIIRFESTWQVDFVNIEDPQDRVTVFIPAHANDQSDKAPGKACSYAVKYALLKVLSLETGENEESRVEADRKADQMLDLIKENVQEYIDAGDSLAVYLTAQKAGHEVWTDLYNSAPEGKKTAYKKELSALETKGAEIYKAINQAILQNDSGAASDNTHDLTPECKRMLAAKLGSEKTKVLGTLLESLK